MLLPESIAIGSFVLSTIGFMYKMSRDVAEIKKEVNNDIKHISEEEDGKRGRIYARLDEVKKQSDEKFVIKDMCRVLHEQIVKKMDEMATDIKTLINR